MPNDRIAKALLGYGGVEQRQPYPSESNFFRANPHVAGMATEDNRVALNPFSGLSDDQQRAVVKNESARVWMRRPEWLPSFNLTQDQQQSFAQYGSPSDQRSTIAARLISGDPSAGTATQQQLEFAQRLAAELERQGYQD